MLALEGRTVKLESAGGAAFRRLHRPRKPGKIASSKWNQAPADLPKQAASFDLPITLLVAATRLLDMQFRLPAKSNRGSKSGDMLVLLVIVGRLQTMAA
jgi:hypothetical protein